jgi:hypothetical protein
MQIAWTLSRYRVYVARVDMRTYMYCTYMPHIADKGIHDFHLLSCLT